MYMLTVSVNGETVRAEAFASVIDATDDYAAALAASYPLALATDAETATAYLTTDPSVQSVSAAWEVPNPASDAGDGPTESDRYVVRVARVSAEDVESDGIPFVGSRAVEILDQPSDLSAGTVTMAEIMADVAREFVNA
jgi:hypothetical protein